MYQCKWAYVFILFVIGCSNNSDATDSVFDMDTNDLSDMDHSEMTSECSLGTSDLVVERVLSEFEGEGMMQHTLSLPNSLASMDGIGARLQNGISYIYLKEQRKDGNLGMRLEVSKQPLSLPMQYCLDDFYDTDGYCNTREARVSFVLYTGDNTSTGMANIRDGQVVLKTCPTVKGSRVIGQFIDVGADLGFGDDTTTTFSAKFNVVLFESDESWNCQQVTGSLCEDTN